MNIKYITRLLREAMPWRFEFKLPDEVISHRNEIVLRAMLRFYPKDVIDQVLTNRRSDYTDDALIEDFFRTEQPEHVIPKDEHLTEAIEYCRKINEPDEVLYPISFPDLRYYPWSLPVSAEMPWTLPEFKFMPFETDYDWKDPAWTWFKRRPAKRFRVREWLRYKQAIGVITDEAPSFHNLYDELFVYNRALVHEIKYGSKNFWTREGYPIPYYWRTLHARSHVVSSDEPDKIRAVFGDVKLQLMVENMFIWQLQRKRLNEDQGCMLWGREIMRGGWKKLKREIESEGSPNTILAIDWSEFDKRLLFELIIIVHSIWRSYFDFSKYQATSFYPNPKPKSSYHIERLWKWMCFCVLYTAIMLPDGRIYHWTRNGFGSGLQQTQIMDSDANLIMILTCLSSLGINIKSERFWIRVQGDDSLVTFFERTFEIYGPHFLNMLADSAKYYFNAKLNVKKSKIGRRLTGMTVLGYFNNCGLPYRTDEDLLRHLFFPERDQDWTRLAASANGLARAGVGNIRFYNVCLDIWNFLTKEMQIKPKFSALRWMERAGMIERAEALADAPFPTRTEIVASCWDEPIRDEAAKQRLWPTRPGPAGRFYFISNTPQFA